MPPLKFVVKKDKYSVMLSPPESYSKQLDLRSIKVDFFDVGLAISLRSSNNRVSNMSKIHTVLNNFARPYNNRFSDMFENGAEDRFTLNTNRFELTKEEPDQLIECLISSIKESLPIGSLAIEAFVNALIELGYKPPLANEKETTNTNNNNTVSTSVHSIFNEKEIPSDLNTTKLDLCNPPSHLGGSDFN